MFIHLNPASTTPIFQQIHDRIIEGIARGEIRHGDKLDPVRRVAAEFGINPATVQKAYDLLRADGVVVTEKRTGSTVRISARPTDEQRAQLHEKLNRTASRAAIQGFTEEEIHAELASVLAEITIAGSSEAKSNGQIRKTSAVRGPQVLQRGATSASGAPDPSRTATTTSGDARFLEEISTKNTQNTAKPDRSP
ncbi:GntR family transcriptional regulator [Corynebacterium urogenitale]